MTFVPIFPISVPGAQGITFARESSRGPRDCLIMVGLSSWIFMVSLAGVLSQFSPPSGDICPGSDIEFSCVGNSLSVSNTRWEITPDGGEPICVVLHNQPTVMLTCGPGEIFTSSLDVNAEVNYTSSLRAEDVPLSLNGTIVECVDGVGPQPIGSTNICIVGKHDPFHCVYIRLIIFLSSAGVLSSPG